MAIRKIKVSQLILCLLVGVTGINGKPPTTIVGGSFASENEFPYLVGIMTFGQHICGGSIIDSTHILTAAHCVDDKDSNLARKMVIVTGTNNIRKGNRYLVKNVTKHALYSAVNSWKNDIAVITLRTAIKFNDREQAVKLPTNDTLENVMATASGWGDLFYPKGLAPTALRKLDMNVISNSKCIMPAVVIHDSHLCAFAKLSSGLCSGDSGGPLVSNGELVGIASFVMPCGKGYPDVFTRVYRYIDWIKNIVESS